MAKQTQREKKLAQINAARQAGQLTQQQAQAARAIVKDNSKNGDVSKAGEQALRDLLNKATGNTGGGNNNGGGTGGGGRDDNRFPDGGPIKGPTTQPPGTPPPGQEYVWNGDDWFLQPIPGWEDPNKGVNAEKPTGEPGEGMYWAPVIGPDGTITSWVATPIPGWKPETPAGPAPGHSAADKAGAKQRLKELLTRYGLTELIDTVNNLVEEWGSNNDSVIMSYLRESTPYKQRFKGNEDRIAKGYGALSEAEYIGVETQIRAKMRDFGLGDAFYSNEKIAGLIGGDVSADEVSDRLTKAKKIVDNADVNIKSSLVNLYGAGLGDLIGYVLDPALAQEQLQRKVNAGIAYGVAKGQGLDLDRDLSEQIGELTYGDERTARQSLGQAGVLAESVRRLKNIDGIDITDADVVEQQFGLDAEAGTKVKKLQSRERARFTGSSGAFGGTLQSNNY